MRRLIASFVSALLFLPVAAASAASAKAGAACTKAGATTTVAGKKLICAKVSKKLKWKIVGATKPVVVPVTPIEISSAKDAKVDGACLASGSESFTSSGPMRCTSGKWRMVAESEDSIATRAFRSLLKRYNENAAKELSLQFVIQPEAPEILKSIEQGMRAGARLWNPPTQRDEPYPVLIGVDGKWLRSTSENMGLYSPENSWTNLSNQALCSYAEFKLDLGRKPWYLYCFHPKQAYGVGFLQVGAHEYTHLAQFAYLGVFADQSKQEMTPWFQEGFASYVGTLMSFASGSGFALRSEAVMDLGGVRTPLSDYSERFPAQWEDVYPLGTFAAEALVALFGIDVMEKVCLERSRGGRFDDALIKVTAKSVAQWTPILQGYIDSVKSGKPWTLAELQKAAT